MRVIFDCGHPTHVHFFRHLILGLKDEGHEALVAARDKDVTLELLERLGLPHVLLGRRRRGLGLALEFAERNLRLLALARRFKPQALMARSAVCVGPVGRLLGIPSLVHEDTEHAWFQQFWTMPLASCVFTGSGYPKDLGRHHVRYRGVGAMAYLSPRYFRPDPEPLRRAGVDPDEPYTVLRLVAWAAAHDTGHRGCTEEQALEAVRRLSTFGRVLVSSETSPPTSLAPFLNPVPSAHFHDLLAFARLCIGEGGATAIEAAMLGTPAVLANPLQAGVLQMLEERGLLTHCDSLAEGLDAAERLLGAKGSHAAHRERLDRLLAESDDVVDFMHGLLMKVTGH